MCESRGFPFLHRALMKINYCRALQPLHAKKTEDLGKMPLDADIEGGSHELLPAMAYDAKAGAYRTTARNSLNPVRNRSPCAAVQKQREASTPNALRTLTKLVSC